MCFLKVRCRVSGRWSRRLGVMVGPVPLRWSSGSRVLSSPATSGSTVLGPSVRWKCVNKDINEITASVRYGLLCWVTYIFLSLLWCQNLACGHGTRYRKLSCVVSDGSFNDKLSLVDEELCEGLEQTGDGDKPVRLKETCTLPCPGIKAVHNSGDSSSN